MYPYVNLLAYLYIVLDPRRIDLSKGIATTALITMKRGRDDYEENDDIRLAAQELGSILDRGIDVKLVVCFYYMF